MLIRLENNYVIKIALSYYRVRTAGGERDGERTFSLLLSAYYISSEPSITNFPEFMCDTSREIALMIWYNDIKMQIRVITRYKPATIIVIHRDMKRPAQVFLRFLRQGGSYKFHGSFLFHFDI